jgi:hypothetical protein
MKHTRKQIQEAARRFELAKWAADIQLTRLDILDSMDRRIAAIKADLEKLNRKGKS